MNNDNNGPATYRFHSSMSNQGVPISSNPFTSIIRNSRVRSPGPAGRHDESLLRRERQVDENSFQTPQQKQKIRLFQTQNHDKSSTLTPYINLLRGCQANVVSVQQSQLRSHEVRRPKTPPQPSSSPVPKQEQWTKAETTSTVPSHEEIAFMINDVTEESEFEELKRAYKTIAEQNKVIETLRFQVISLKNSRCTLSRENMQMNQELEMIREKMGECSARTSLLQGQLERSDAALNAKIRELTKQNDVMRVKEEKVSQLMERLEQVSNEAEEAKTAYTQEVTRGKGLSVQVVDANKRIQELVKGYGIMEKNLQELGDSYNTYRLSTNETLREAMGLKSYTTTVLEGVINTSNVQKLLSEAKVALADLRDELSESHRVNDLLRDKLHITTAQLAEVTGHVRELEAEKREVWERMLPSVPENLESEKLREALATLEKREKESAAKILSLQEHGIVLLGRSAELEAKSNQVEKSNGELNSEIAILRPLHQEKLHLQTEVANLTRRLSEETTTRMKLQDCVVETKDALITAENEAFMLRTQMQEALNSRNETGLQLSNIKIALKDLEVASRSSEKELQAQHETLLSSLQENLSKLNQDAAVLRAKNEFLENQHDQLRISLSQEQISSARLQQELKETSIRELVATGKIEMHEARMISLTKEMNSKDELLHQLNVKLASAQDRYEVQASTLQLTKEELGDMCEKLENANKNSSAAEVAFRTEIAVLQEQKSRLSTELNQTHQDMKVQGDVSSKRMIELQGIIQELQTEVQHLNDARVDCENTMRREAADRSAAEETYKKLVKELQGVIVKLNVERDEEARRTITLEKSAVLDLEVQVKALIEEKEEMLDRQKTFHERYRARTLSDVEKDIVASLLRDAKDLYEQAVVEKDNEIKRRDATISALQARIEDLELSLVQAYHPTEAIGDQLTILSLKISPNPLAPSKSIPQQPEPRIAPKGTDSIVVPTQVDSRQDTDNLNFLPSQMPSELSTPPQSPFKSKGGPISFVLLSGEDSEAKNGSPEFFEKSSTKRRSENDPIPKVAPSKKRQRTNVTKMGNQEDKGVSELTGRGRQKKKKMATRGYTSCVHP